MGVTAGSGKVFRWLADMTAITGLTTWFGICYTYIRFYAGMKAQGIDRKTLPFSSCLQPYAAWYGAIICLVICFVRVSVVIHSQLIIDQKTNHHPSIVYRLVGLPPWKLGHGRFSYILLAPCDVPNAVRWRDVLDACTNRPSLRDGLLHRDRRGRGK